MSYCIITTTPEFIELKNKANVPENILKAEIALWQQNNNTDEYPTLKQLGIEERQVIKPGVQELFDSNPELANQVYEALGFKTFDTKGVSLDVKDRDGWKWIKLNNKNIGEVKLVKNDRRSKEVGLSIKLNEEYRNKGYGQIVHTLVADWAKNEFGDTLYSDFDNSKAEINTLLALTKKGFAEQIGNYGVEEDGRYSTEERAFRIKTSDEIQQITPQQKQQALQSYSQYLDSIFPNSQVKDIVYHGSYDKIDKFDVAYTQFGQLYFANKPEYAKGFRKTNYNYQAVINTSEQYDYFEGNDSIEYVVKNNNDIHILGSKQDIDGFKKFTQGKDRKASLGKPKTKVADMDKATKFLQEKLGMTTDEITRVSGLVDGKSFGRMLKDGKILLSDLMEVGTEYHESFHRVWNFYLTPAERQSVLEDFKKDPNYKDKIAYLKKEYPELSEDDLIEEYFGEDFRDFMMGDTTPSTLNEKWYDRILNFFKKILGLSRGDYKKLYKMINEGKFSKAQKLVSEIPTEKDRVSSINSYELKVAEKSELLLNMDYYFSKILFSPNVIKDNNLAVKDIFSFTNGQYSTQDMVDIYQLILQQMYEDLTYSKSPNAKNIIEAINEDPEGALRDLAAEHLKRLSQFNIKTREEKDSDVVGDNKAEDKLKNDIGDSQTDITEGLNNESKEEIGRSTLDIIPATEFNTKDNMPKSIKLLISALLHVDEKGNTIYSTELGLPQAGSWNNNVNILKNSLATLPADINIFIDKIKALTETNPQFNDLLRYLGETSEDFMKDNPYSPENKYLYDLRRSFVSEFALTKYNFYTAIMNESGNLVFIAANIENFLNTLKDSFKNNFEKAFAEFVPSRPANKKEEYFNMLKSTDTPFQTKLAMLGITLNNNLTEKDLTTLRGKVTDLITNIREADNIKKIYATGKDSIVSTRLNEIVKMTAEGMAENTELQFMNIEGKPVYLINLNNYQTIIIDSINYWLDVAESQRENRTEAEMYDLRKEILMKNIPHIFSHQATNSVWINEKILRGQKLEYGVIDGLKSMKLDKAIPTSKLSEGDLLSLNTNMTLSGLSVSMKHSDRGMYPVYKVGTDSTILDPKANIATLYDDTINVIIGYLTDEINKPTPENSIHFMDEALKSKEDFKLRSFFGDIIDFGDFKKLKAGKMDVDSAEIRRQIKVWLTKVVEEDKALFKKYLLDKPYSKQDYEGRTISSVTAIGLSNEHSETFGNKWENAVTYAALEQVLQTYEQSILFVGDVTAYNKSKDLSKRLSTQSSTGKVSLIGEEIDRTVETLNTESIFTIDGQDYIYKENYDIGTIRELVIEDPNIKSYLYDAIKESIKKQLLKDFNGNEQKAEEYAASYAKAYKKYTENDGFSYINIFMAREFEIRSDEWNDAKQRNFDLQIKFLNSGYDLSVIKDDLQVPEGVDIGEWLFKEYGPLTIKKPQYVGPNDYHEIDNQPGLNIIGGRKTAYMPLLPTTIHDVALNAVHEFMLVNSIDVLHMEGAAKFGVKEMRPLYTNEGKWDTQEIFEGQIGRLPWKYMKNQVKIANVPKGKIISSTQARKNNLEGFFDKGVPKDYSGTKEQWDSLSEAKQIEASPIFELIRKYETVQNRIIQNSITKLLESLDTTSITDDSIKYSMEKFRSVLTDSAKSRNSADNIIEAAEDFLRDIKYIELIPNSAKIQPILNSLVTNKVLVQKRLGDMVPQAAVTGFESKPREYDEEGKMISSKDSLKFYEIQPDGSISPAEIIIPVTPEVLQAAFVKYNTRNILEAVQKLNEDVAKGKLEIIAKGLRTPNQQFSSNDVFKIKKFLLPLMQGMAVVPSELVAKTGGDFDIDKISLYYYHLDKKGNKIKYYETHTDELFDVFLEKKGVYKKQGDIKTDPNYKSFSTRISNLEAQLNILGIEATNAFIEFANSTTGKQASTFKEAKENLLEQRKINKNRIDEINERLGSVYRFSLEQAEQERVYIEDFKQREAERKLLQEQNALIKKQIEDFYTETQQEKDLEAKKKSAIKAIRTRKTNIKEAYREEFEATPVKDINSQEALENYYLDIEIAMLLHPSQIKNLYSPVADTPLQSSKDDHLTSEDRKGISMSKLFTNSYNVLASIRFVSGKAGVGQLATWITFANLFQRYGVKLNKDYPNVEIPIKGFENRLDLGNTLANDPNGINESVSIVLSALLTSQVDLVKDPYAEALNIINQTLDTIAYMVVRGIPVATIIDIINNPLVSEFLEAERINQSMVVGNTGIKNENNPNGLKLSNEKLKLEFIKGVEDKIITVEQIKSKDSSIQKQVLSMFLNLREQSKDINSIKRYYSPDTKYLKDRNSVIALEDLYYNINNESTVPIVTIEEQDKLITNGSLLESFHEGRKLYSKLFNDFFFIDKMQTYQFIKKKIANGLYLTEDESNKFFNDIDQNFITFLLQNNLSFIQDYQLTFDNVMKGKESVANYIAKVKSDPRYKNNMFVKNLLPLINYKDSNIDNFRSFKGKGVTSFINEQSEAFDEIMDQDPNFGVLLLVGNVFQSGTYNSMFQLNKFLPYETQKIVISELNDVIDDVMSDEQTRSEVVNEFLHKYLLSHPQYIPEAWKFNPNNNSYQKIKMFPYALDNNGDIILVNNGTVTGRKVEKIGNYQGIDYISDVPMTDNFMAIDVIRPGLTARKTAEVTESDDTTLTPIKGLNERLEAYGNAKVLLSSDFYEGARPKGRLNAFKSSISTVADNLIVLADLNLNEFDFLSEEDKKGLDALRPLAKELGKINTSDISSADRRTVAVEKRYAALTNQLANEFVDIIGKHVEQQLGKEIMTSSPRLVESTEESDIFVPASDLKKTNPYEVKPGVEPVTTDENDVITIDNFDDFFPEYKDLSTNEKIQLLRGMNNDDLNKTCKIG
jgi:hypothetical protein